MRGLQMTKIQLFTGMLLLALAPFALAQKTGEATKKLYCWNEGGRKVCGDALPATAVDSARTEISAKSGLPTGHLDRAPSADERAATIAAAEVARQGALADEARLRREMAMVESYSNEAELRRAYEHRISLSEGTVKASRMSVGGLRNSLLTLLQRAGNAELSGRPVPKPLAGNIRQQHDELLRQQNMLVQQQRDASTIEDEFADALSRYRALKTSAAASSASANGS